MRLTPISDPRTSPDQMKQLIVTVTAFHKVQPEFETIKTPI